MNWLKNLQTKFTYYKYKIFPQKFNTTNKGDCVADYCRRILEEDLPDAARIQAYEDIIASIQKQTNSSRTLAVIYILSVLSEVHQDDSN